MFDRHSLSGTAPALRGGASIALVTALLAISAGCGGSMAFSDKSSLVIKGEPPAPPPPKVAEPEPPPKPKRVEVTQDKIIIKDKIQFDTNKTTIKSESDDLLDEIVSVIKENPNIHQISIEGHTDSDGSDSYNLKLSDGRAHSVMDYFVQHGIEADRLVAKGFGETKPIGDNKTVEGKEENRRVEFLITEQDKVKKTYEVDPTTGERKEVDAKKHKKKADKSKSKEEKAE